MKKLLYVLIIIGLTMALLYSCKKDTDKMQKEPTNEQQYTDYEWEIYYRLQAYKHNSSLKSSNPISLDSAEWYMETQFNVEEATTIEPYSLIQKDSTYYTLILNGSGMVELSSMNTMYNEILDDVDSIEYVISNPEAIPVFAHLELLSKDENEAEMMLVLGIGNYFSGYYAPFYDIDDWYYGNNLGRTDGEYLYLSDAGQELGKRINNPFFQYFQPGAYVEPRESVEVRYDDYPDIYSLNPESNVGYLTYYEVSTSFPSPVLENEELTFYLNNLHNIVYTYDDQTVANSDQPGKHPPGFVFEYLTTWTDTDPITGGYYYEHAFTIHYATRVNIPLPQ